MLKASTKNYDNFRAKERLCKSVCVLFFRSMEELDPPDEDKPRCSVKELVARIQQKQKPNEQSAASYDQRDDRSESSDDDVNPERFHPPQASVPFDTVATDAPPRSRSGVYSPTIVNVAQVDPRQLQTVDYGGVYVHRPNPPLSPGYRYGHSEIRNLRLCEPNANESSTKYTDLNTRFAKLRMLDSAKMFNSTKEMQGGVNRVLNASKVYESTVRMLDNPHDVVDNNDSGYSTKVYGSSKGNSPSLSGGQVEADCIRSSSLV